MDGKDIVQLINALYKEGIDLKTINKFLNGIPIRDEESAFLILHTIRKYLKPKVLLEDEVGGLNSTPTYTIVLQYSKYIILYKASHRIHEIRLFLKNKEEHVLDVARKFIEKNNNY